MVLMGPWSRILFLGWVLGCFAAVAGAQLPSAPPPGRRTIQLARIPRVSRAPRLDDFLQDKPREAELVIDDFRQYVPGDGTAASERSTAYLSYDEKNLYAVFVCHDASGQVRAHLSKREDVGQDDGVGIYLDTFQDHHRAYVFFSNPLGIQSDSISTEGQSSDFSFDTAWRSHTLLTPHTSLACLSI